MFEIVCFLILFALVAYLEYPAELAPLAISPQQENRTIDYKTAPEYVEHLKKSGVVRSLNIEDAEAFVDDERWKYLKRYERIEAAQMLAYYSSAANLRDFPLIYICNHKTKNMIAAYNTNGYIDR